MASLVTSTASSVASVEVEGLTYSIRVGGQGVPLALVHGFTGSALDWDRVVPQLNRFCRTIRIDLPGHGETEIPSDPNRFTLPSIARDIKHLLHAVGVSAGGRQRAFVAGYSLGGRVAMHVALAAPDLLHGLILESASPGIADPQARAARRREDLALAQWIEEHGTAAFVARWERLPLFASQRHLPPEVRERQRADRLRRSAAALAGSLRGASVGAQAPLLNRLWALNLPSLLIAGSLDEKYCEIAREMHGGWPHAALSIVPGAGHNVHLEAPDAYVDQVQRFITATLNEHPLGEDPTKETKEWRT